MHRGPRSLRARAVISAGVVVFVGGVLVALVAVITVVALLVPTFFIVTFADGTTAPFESVTVPLMPPRLV